MKKKIPKTDHDCAIFSCYNCEIRISSYPFKFPSVPTSTQCRILKTKYYRLDKLNKLLKKI